MIYITGCGFMTGITDSRGSEVCVTEVRLNHANFGQANFLRRESLLTVRETASLMGVTERWVQRLIKNGAIKSETVNGQGGDSGINFRIPLAALDERFQLKYERKLRGCSEPPPDETDIKPLNTLSLTEDERDEIAQNEFCLNHAKFH
jgi:excisionase family DNA binding protein